MVLENEPQIERVPFVKLEAYFQRLSSDPNNPTFIMYIDEREQSHGKLTDWRKQNSRNFIRENGEWDGDGGNDGDKVGGSHTALMRLQVK